MWRCFSTAVTTTATGSREAERVAGLCDEVGRTTPSTLQLSFFVCSCKRRGSVDLFLSPEENSRMIKKNTTATTRCFACLLDMNTYVFGYYGTRRISKHAIITTLTTAATTTPTHAIT